MDQWLLIYPSLLEYGAGYGDIPADDETTVKSLLKYDGVFIQKITFDVHGTYGYLLYLNMDNLKMCVLVNSMIHLMQKII